MPYMKSKLPHNAKLLELIEGRRKVLGITQAELAKKLGFGTCTLLRRLENPDLFTVGELSLLSTALHVPYFEIVSTLQK